MIRATPLMFGIHGPSGSGKTTLIERLIPELRTRGLRVGTVKHVTHAPRLDTPGKDSHRHAAAGAACVALIGAGAGAFFAHADEPDDLDAWVRLFDGRVDVVLVEGYRAMSIPAVSLSVADVPSPPDWPAGHARQPPAWQIARSRTAIWPDVWPRPVVCVLAEVVAAMAQRRESVGGARQGRGLRREARRAPRLSRGRSHTALP